MFPFMPRMNIFLIRHAESESNVDLSVHSHTPDPAIRLSPRGYKQAIQLGEALGPLLLTASNQYRHPTRIMVSPYRRTRETLEGIGIGSRSNPSNNNASDMVKSAEKIHENIALREIEYGVFDGITVEERPIKLPLEHACYQRHLDHEGWVYARMPLGESPADVVGRAKLVLHDIERAYRKGVKQLIIVSHSQTIRCIRMEMEEQSVQWLTEEPSPPNTSTHYYTFNGINYHHHGHIYDGEKICAKDDVLSYLKRF